MKKIIRLTESDLVKLVNRVIKEQSEVDESAFTFGDKVRNKLGKLVDIPETSDDEKRLAEDILAKVESGEYDVLDTFDSFELPKGYRIKVSLNDGDYIVKIKKERVNLAGGHLTYTNVTTPDGEKVNILAKGFTNKLIDLIKKDDKGKRFRYPKK
jgi:transcription antitermination factor NusA-like protein